MKSLFIQEEAHIQESNECLDNSSQELYYPEKATTYPISFSQVREDPWQDEAVLKQYFQGPVAMLMIASGGDTATYLLGKGYLSELSLVDINPAQIYLTQLKLHLLAYSPKKKVGLLGYDRSPTEKQKQHLAVLMDLLDIPLGAFGKIHLEGLGHTGKYECVFEALREHLSPYQQDIDNLFQLQDVQAQVRMIASTTPFGRSLDVAFQEVMSQKNLVKIFGKGATSNRVQDFHLHFAQKTRLYLSRHLACQSPFFAQMFLGKFYNDLLYPWLSLPKTQKDVPVSYVKGIMQKHLKCLPTARYDVIHLSNILDWLSVQEAKETLSLAYKVLKPGGVVIIRQLNSQLDIPAMSHALDWDLIMGKCLTEQDRSFFYSNFYVGTKPHHLLAPQLTAMADEVLKNITIGNNSFFTALQSGKMALNQFNATQKKFFYAIKYFSRPMAVLLSRFNDYKSRIKILDNILEEHGHFNITLAHTTTFKILLDRLGCDLTDIDTQAVPVEVMTFNQVLMNVAQNENPLFGVACFGIIEYAFAVLSSQIGKSILKHGWLTKEKLIHYNVHAELDKVHAAEFFSIAELYVDDFKVKNRVQQGMMLGAHIFNQLYEQLYQKTITQIA